MTTEIVQYEAQPVERHERMTPAEISEQVNLIQTIMRSVMKKDEHYGVIPGTGDKPSLLKPGAEKLLLTFRLGAFPDVEVIDLGAGHREYRVTCRLRSLATGIDFGVGVGSASTHETKWRYRSENTGRPVPPEYWESRDPNLLGGQQFSVRKIGSAWMVFHKVPHDNPADYYNTCLKMAKKRALVDAVLTSLAASDIFTQDVEELRENGVLPGEESGEEKRTPPEKPPAPKSPPPAPAEEEPLVVIGIVKDVQRKTGVKDGKPWTKSDVFVGEYTFSTFDKKIGERAEELIGMSAKVFWKASGKYRNIVGIMENVDDFDREPGQEG